MPMYDYRCGDKVVELIRRPEDREFIHTDGSLCVRVWLSAPGIDIPIHHQAAPKESAEVVELSRRAADKNDPIREKDKNEHYATNSIKRDKAAKHEKRLDDAITDVLRDVV